VVCGECGSSLLKPMQWRNAIRDSEMLDRTAKLVCFVISTYMNGKGVAYPGKETIARGAGLGKGRRSVDGAIDRAEAAGYLEVTRSKGRRPFRYSATAPNVAGDAPSNLAEDAPLEDATSHLATANVARMELQRRSACDRS
jgi:hypothetical protein